MQQTFQATLQGGNAAEHLYGLCAAGIWRGVWVIRTDSPLFSLAFVILPIFIILKKTIHAERFMRIECKVNDHLTHLFETDGAVIAKETGSHHLEVYQSKMFGKVIVIDGESLYLQNESVMMDEMLVHVPMCVHTEAKKVLILGGIHAGAAYEFHRHNDVHVDMIEPDVTLVQTLREYFGYAETSWNNPRFSFAPSEWTGWISEFQAGHYDIVVVNPASHRFSPDDAFLNDVKRVLKPEGVCVFKSPHLIYCHSAFKGLLEMLATRFRIAMPYVSGHATVPFTMLFASDQFHPTADLMLQKAEMLDELNYYTPELHKAAFSLPKFLEGALAGIAKN